MRKFILMTLVLACLGFSHSVSGIGQAEKPGPRVAKSRFVAYYFHGQFRCPTCLKIERLSTEAIRRHFGDLIDQGVLELKVINTDLAENRHFKSDFDLNSPTLVIVRLEGGTVKLYRKLDAVWEVVHGPDEEFNKYVAGEVSKFISAN